MVSMVFLSLLLSTGSSTVEGEINLLTAGRYFVTIV